MTQIAATVAQLKQTQQKLKKEGRSSQEIEAVLEELLESSDLNAVEKIVARLDFERPMKGGATASLVFETVLLTQAESLEVNDIRKAVENADPEHIVFGRIIKAVEVYIKQFPDIEFKPGLMLQVEIEALAMQAKQAIVYQKLLNWQQQPLADTHANPILPKGASIQENMQILIKYNLDSALGKLMVNYLLQTQFDQPLASDVSDVFEMTVGVDDIRKNIHERLATYIAAPFKEVFDSLEEKLQEYDRAEDVTEFLFKKLDSYCQEITAEEGEIDKDYFYAVTNQVRKFIAEAGIRSVEEDSDIEQVFKSLVKDCFAKLKTDAEILQQQGLLKLQQAKNEVEALLEEQIQEFTKKYSATWFFSTFLPAFKQIKEELKNKFASRQEMVLGCLAKPTAATGGIFSKDHDARCRKEEKETRAKILNDAISKVYKIGNELAGMGFTNEDFLNNFLISQVIDRHIKELEERFAHEENFRVQTESKENIVSQITNMLINKTGVIPRPFGLYIDDARLNLYLLCALAQRGGVSIGDAIFKTKGDRKENKFPEVKVTKGDRKKVEGLLKNILGPEYQAPMEYLDPAALNELAEYYLQKMTDVREKHYIWKALILISPLASVMQKCQVLIELGNAYDGEPSFFDVPVPERERAKIRCFLAAKVLAKQITETATAEYAQLQRSLQEIDRKILKQVQDFINSSQLNSEVRVSALTEYKELIAHIAPVTFSAQHAPDMYSFLMFDIKYALYKLEADKEPVFDSIEKYDCYMRGNLFLAETREEEARMNMAKQLTVYASRLADLSLAEGSPNDELERLAADYFKRAIDLLQKQAEYGFTVTMQMRDEVILQLKERALKLKSEKVSLEEIGSFYSAIQKFTKTKTFDAPAGGAEEEVTSEVNPLIKQICRDVLLFLNSFKEIPMPESQAWIDSLKGYAETESEEILEQFFKCPLENAQRLLKAQLLLAKSNSILKVGIEQQIALVGQMKYLFAHNEGFAALIEADKQALIAQQQKELIELAAEEAVSPLVAPILELLSYYKLDDVGSDINTWLIALKEQAECNEINSAFFNEDESVVLIKLQKILVNLKSELSSPMATEKESFIKLQALMILFENNSAMYGMIEVQVKSMLYQQLVVVLEKCSDINLPTACGMFDFHMEALQHNTLDLTRYFPEKSYDDIWKKIQVVLERLKFCGQDNIRKVGELKELFKANTLFVTFLTQDIESKYAVITLKNMPSKEAVDQQEPSVAPSPEEEQASRVDRLRAHFSAAAKVVRALQVNARRQSKLKFAAAEPASVSVDDDIQPVIDSKWDEKKALLSHNKSGIFARAGELDSVVGVSYGSIEKPQAEKETSCCCPLWK